MPYRLFTLCMSLFIAGCAGDTTAQHQRPSGASLLPAQYRCTKFCTVDFLRNTFRVPRHGLLIGRGAILTEYADWTLVDYDSRSLTRIRTVIESNSTGQFQPRVVERSDTSLSQKEMAAVQTSADRIWASASSVPTQFTYHRVWNSIFWMAKPSGRSSDQEIRTALDVSCKACLTVFGTVTSDKTVIVAGRRHPTASSEDFDFGWFEQDMGYSANFGFSLKILSIPG
jgi:hypothetical protein